MEEQTPQKDGVFAVGVRLRSAASGTEVVVVRPAKGPVVLACAGDDLAPFDAVAPPGPAAGPGDGPATLLGKRYHDEPTGLELLCTRAGRGPLTVDGRPLEVKAAKPLPSSD
jgi:hypothetical protein